MLKFDMNAAKEVKSLIITMVMAVLGSQEEGAVVARGAGVIKNSPALIVTEGYVGVCCTSLKKVCTIMKKHILKRPELCAPDTRDRDYDGMVVPSYRNFPHNAAACENITKPKWNPPTQLISRWLEMCRPEGWAHKGLTRVISLRPLDMDLDLRVSALKMLQDYTGTIKQQLESIVSLENRWQVRDQIKMIVVPVRMRGAWFLYQTTRSGTQAVMRIAKAFKQGGG